jgi:peptidoglycan/LPS O-acetylase OafA/YrhL
LLNSVGIALALLLFYGLGLRVAEKTVGTTVTFLGTYSLLSYLVQIAILQTMLRLVRAFDLPHGDFIIPMVITFGLMLAIVKAVHALRGGVRFVDRAYKVVFA